MLKVAALCAGLRVDDTIDQRWLLRIECLLQRSSQRGRCLSVIPGSAECFDEPVVTAPWSKNSRRGVRGEGIYVVAAITPVVVEYDHDYWQAIPTHRFDFHATEAKRAVAFDRDDLGTGLDR